MKQDEEDDVQFEQEKAASAFEAARQARATVEEKCLLGLINLTRERRAAS